jgi:uncharacterized membrane protein (DUF485 family)
MSTETPVPPGTNELHSPENRYLEIANAPDFTNLRRTFRRFVFPATAAFLLWYALYVLCSAYARDFMDTKVVGHINVALIFGLLQFVSTFLIAWLYVRYMTRNVDPLADALRAKIESTPIERSPGSAVETAVASPVENPLESPAEEPVESPAASSAEEPVEHPVDSSDESPVDPTVPEAGDKE